MRKAILFGIALAVILLFPVPGTNPEPEEPAQPIYDDYDDHVSGLISED